MADAKITELTSYTSPISTDVLPIVDVTTGGTKKITKADLTSNKVDKLTVTGVKTTTYSANINELIPCDISGGSFTVTLPSAPVNGSIIEVKLVTTGTNKVLALTCGGSDKFNTATGNTSIYMTLSGEVDYLQYNSGIWYVFASAATFNWATNFPGVDASTPISNADISFDVSTRILTITPPLGYFNIFVDGSGSVVRYRKTGTINFPAITDTSGMWYFYFNSSGTAVSTQTAWTTSDFPNVAPIYRILWNATLYNFTITSGNVVEGDTYTNNGKTFTIRQTYSGATTIKTSGTGDPEVSGTLTRATGTGDATLTFSAFSIAPRVVAQYVEYHLNDISADDHQWFHLQGTQWVTGFTMVNNALTSGSPNANGSNTVVALVSGKNVDDNLEYSVTNDSTPTDPWQQDLGNITAGSLDATNSALFTIYRQNAAGLITFRDTTRFPFDWNTTTNIPNYITSTGTRTPVTNQRFMVNFIYCTQNPTPGEAIKVVSATQDFTSIANARAYTWSDIQNTYSILSDGEIRPLYRLIHEVHTSTPATYDAGAKYSVLRETQDLRKAAVTSTTASTGSLPASSVTVVASGGISSTNAQSALEELDTEKLDKATYDANSILYATTDNTPIALTIGASTIVGRKSTGDIVALNASETRTILNVADGATANAKISGSTLDTGTDDTGFVTAAAINASHNVPLVAPGNSGNLMTSDGTDWTSAAAPVSVSVTTKGDLQTYSTVPTRLPVGTDGQILESRSSETTGLKWVAAPSASDLTLTTVPNDVSASGIKISLTAHENLAFGDVCYINSSGEAQIIDADAITTMSGLLMAIATINADASGNFLMLGIARNDAWNWTVGGIIYGTTTGTSGNTLSQTAPTGTDDVVQIMGVATHADRMFFNPQLVQVERV